MCRIYIVLIFFIISNFTLFAQTQTPTPKVWVVSIGVGKYTRNFAALRSANDGARQIAKAINDLNPTTTTAFTLTTDSPEMVQWPTKENVVEIFTRLNKRIRADDRVIVYFCGHGVESNGKPYLLLMNVTDVKETETLETGSISVDWLREKLNGMQCKERLLWLDACRVETLEASGAGDGYENATPLTKTMSAQLSSGDGMAITYYGCRAGERVYYSKDGPSFFTNALLDGLKGEAIDKRGRITMYSLSRYVNERVPILVNEQNSQLQQHPDIFPAQFSGETMILKSAPGAILCNPYTGDYGVMFAETIYTRLAASGEVNLVERAQLDKALVELNLQYSGLTDPGNAQKTGKFCNALYMLVGSSMPSPGGLLQVNIRLVGVEDVSQIPGVAGECTIDPHNEHAWKPALKELTETLLNAMAERGLIPPRKKEPKYTVIVKTLLPQCQVWVNDHYIADTDEKGVVNLQYLKGKYNIIIKKQGYPNWSSDLNVKEDNSTIVTMPLIKQLPSSLDVEVLPAIAKVMVNGVIAGVGHQNFTNIETGKFVTISATLPGYETEKEPITLQPGDNKKIKLQLKPLPCKINLKTIPPGVKVIIDGKMCQEVTPCEIIMPMLESAEQKIQVEMVLNDYYSIRDRLDISRSKQISLQYTLIKIIVPETITASPINLPASSGMGALMAISSDGSMISDTSENKIRVTDYMNNKIISSFGGFHSRIGAFAFSSSSKFLAASGGLSAFAGETANGEIVIWDARTGIEVDKYTRRGRGFPSCALAFSPDDTLLASGGVDGVINVWQRPEWKSVAVFDGKRDNAVTAIAFTDDQTALLAGYADGTLRLWKIKTGKSTKVLTGNNGIAKSISMLPDNFHVLIAYNNGQLLTWNLTTGIMVKKIELNNNTAKALTISSNGKYLISNNGTMLYGWDIKY